MDGEESYMAQSYPQFTVPVTPPGLESIYEACRRLYPDQPNPLQVTALVKCWLGGPDPLDYISMYANPGDIDKGIPPHWHYVSFGLSDLHGDGRVHECSTSDSPSGFGFELTFRLRRENEETAPPTWPAALMQALARYVFQSENKFCSGDHVPWHSPLDGSESRIQHMLMTDDAQLPTVNTPFGPVNFVQIVGVCTEELKAAAHWNGPGVIELLKGIPVAGGEWLISDMRRGESIFEIEPTIQEQVDRGLETEGSNLSGVSGRCSWEEPHDIHYISHDNDGEEDKENRLLEGERRGSQELERPHISDFESEQIKATLKKGLFNSKPLLPPIHPTENVEVKNKDNNKNQSRKESFDSNVSSEAPTELLRTRVLDNVHLKFNLETGHLLPLALKGRLQHGWHFTFKSVLHDIAFTLVPTSVVGSIADEHHPYAAHGPWLQVLLTNDFIEQLLEDLKDLPNRNDLMGPKTYRWPEKKIAITILPDEL